MGTPKSIDFDAGRPRYGIENPQFKKHWLNG